MSTDHRSTSRVLDILEILAFSEDGFSLTEIASAIDAPKSSIFPIVHTLHSREYIKMNSNTSKYTIGIRSLALSSAYHSNNSILSYIRKEMQRIVDICSETCQLGILDKGNILYLEKIDSPEPIRMISHVGTRLPAYCTGLGKALLSEHSKEELKSLFPNGFEKFTPNTISDIDTLYDQLQIIKQTQIACDCEEVTEHMQCYAIAIRKNGVMQAALSISVPVFRLSKEKINLIEETLLESRDRIESLMTKLNFDFKSLY